jgi:hypothetical protein
VPQLVLDAFISAFRPLNMIYLSSLAQITLIKPVSAIVVTLLVVVTCQHHLSTLNQSQYHSSCWISCPYYPALVCHLPCYSNWDQCRFALISFRSVLDLHRYPLSGCRRCLDSPPHLLHTLQDPLDEYPSHTMSHLTTS